jgi:threonine synthase
LLVLQKEMETLSPVSLFSLFCSSCGKQYDDVEEQATYALCCKQPLLVKRNTKTFFSKESLSNRPPTMWRYLEQLPIYHKKNIVSLGEGMTPIVQLSNLSNRYGLSNLFLKDESGNPTGSFKARGLSMAISKVKENGIEHCIIPTAGNAGGAMAAYCAKAGIRATVVMPRHTPAAFKQECELFGARLVLINGLINDCAAEVLRINEQHHYFDVSTMKEPYRLEGKKTLGYEIAEQFNWKLPDAIVYPTGGGTGLIGIWKAFHEMIEMNWIQAPLPKMVAVQATNCAPIVKTWQKEQPNCREYQGKPTLANGLAVPRPFAEKLILNTLKESGGAAISVSDEQMIMRVKELAIEEGILVAPEGGAIWEATLQLLQLGILKQSNKILLLNTGSGYKYLENIV